MKNKITLIVMFVAFSIIGFAQNIYNTDGTLSANRTLIMNNNTLTFLNNGSLLSNTNIMSGFVLRGITGGRLLDKGVSLEFAIPADTDGSNYWSQGRIITIAGNTNNRNAVGKMVLGTRRYFNKYGTGIQWYFGDDLTIDGIGNIGIGTLSPQSKLDVRGTIIADEVQIKVNKGADFVFSPNYELKNLSDLESFIKKNMHLPEIPSEEQMIKDGIGVNEMQIKLLQKIEELTLYVIEQNKKIEKLEIENKKINEQLKLTEQLP